MGRLILRPEQQAVLDGYRGGYAAISAVPGSGKTTTLSALAADLIASKRLARHQRVVVVTYQNAAVANFQRQMRERLAERDLPDRGYIVRTHHGLASDILRATQHRRLLDAETRIASQTETTALLDQSFRTVWADQAQTIQDRLGLDEHQFNGIVNTNYIRGQLSQQPMAMLQIHGSKINSNDDSRWIPALQPVLDDYNSRLREAGLLDYNSLLVDALQALRADPELCRMLRSRWAYLLEDEAQDCTPLQSQILELLVGKHGNLLRVGDSNQAILTSFTAGDIEIFRHWCNDPNVKTYPLYGSSRSQPAIVTLANRFVDWVRSDFPLAEVRDLALDARSIVPIDGENPAVPFSNSRGLTVKEFKTTRNEQDEVLNRALGHLERNPKARVAILVGRKATGYSYADLALKPIKDRPFPTGFPDNKLIRMLGSQDGSVLPVIGKLIALIAYLQQPSKWPALVNALSAWSTERDSDRTLQIVRAHEGDTESLLYPPSGPPLAGIEFDDEASQQTLRRLRAIPLLLNNRLIAPHELLSLIASSIEPTEVDQVTLSSLVAQSRVVELPEGNDRLSQLFKWLNEVRRNNYELRGTIEQHLIDIDEGTLTIATRHQAKGLEWDIVFAVECDDFWFPTDRPKSFAYNEDLGYDPISRAVAEIEMLTHGLPSIAATEQGADFNKVSESMRVLYVTITRARLACWISWHNTGENNNARTESAAISAIGRLMQEVRDEISP